MYQEYILYQHLFPLLCRVNSYSDQPGLSSFHLIIYSLSGHSWCCPFHLCFGLSFSSPAHQSPSLVYPCIILFSLHVRNMLTYFFCTLRRKMMYGHLWQKPPWLDQPSANWTRLVSKLAILSLIYLLFCNTKTFYPQNFCRVKPHISQAEVNAETFLPVFTSGYFAQRHMFFM